jgi:hypothetical protein
MNETISSWVEKQRNYLAVSIVCFLIGTYFFMNVINGSYIIKQSELQVYENLIISTSPKFKEKKGKNRKKWIEFSCINNQSTFQIASYDYSCVNDNEVINEIKAGDTISLAILKNEIGNFDKESSCEIHSLIKDDKEYLNLDCRNKIDNDGGKRGFLLLFTISTLTAIVYSLSKKPKIFDEVNPEFLISIIVIILFFILVFIL